MRGAGANAALATLLLLLLLLSAGPCSSYLQLEKPALAQIFDGPGAMCDTLSAGPSGSCTGWGLTQLSSPHHKRSTDPSRYRRALHADIYRRRTASSRALDDYGLLRRPAQSHLANLFEEN